MNRLEFEKTQRLLTAAAKLVADYHAEFRAVRYKTDDSNVEALSQALLAFAPPAEPRFTHAAGARPFFKYWIGDDVGQATPIFGLEVVMNDGRIAVADLSLEGLSREGLIAPIYPSLELWDRDGRPVYERDGALRWDHKTIQNGASR
jgi:hypothetical protein